MSGGPEKIQTTNIKVPNNISSMKYALKSVPGFGVTHGDGDGLRTPAPGSGSKIDLYHVDQREKLKGLDAQYLA